MKNNITINFTALEEDILYPIFCLLKNYRSLFMNCISVRLNTGGEEITRFEKLLYFLNPMIKNSQR